MIVSNVVPDGIDTPMYEDENGNVVFEEDIIEYNTTWSEEDEDYYDAIIAKLEITQDDAALTDNQMEFLKSLKDRVQPQPKQEWSKEDEEMIDCLSNCLDELKEKNEWRYVYINNKDVELNKLRKWLKSIKDKVQPQPKQEWGEEDNIFFKAIIRDIDNTQYISEDAKKNRINWLKSIKDKVQSQLK